MVRRRFFHGDPDDCSLRTDVLACNDRIVHDFVPFCSSGWKSESIHQVREDSALREDRVSFVENRGVGGAQGVGGVAEMFITHDNVWRLIMAVLLFGVLFPFSMSNYGRRKWFGPTMLLHVICAILFTIDQIRRGTKLSLRSSFLCCL